MSTLAVALAKIAVLEARLDALEAGRGVAPSSASSSSGSSSSNGGQGGGETLPDHALEKDWADKKILKDPKGWKGRTQVGRWYSDAPPEWLESMAGFYDWKAQKGREDVPVRLNNKGKPWHESDTFEAKLLRTWARRNASKATAKPTVAKPSQPIAEDEFPFGANAKNDVDEGVGF